MLPLLITTAFIVSANAHAALPACDSVEVTDLGPLPRSQKSDVVLEAVSYLMDVRTNISATVALANAAIHLDDLTSPMGGPPTDLFTNTSGEFASTLASGDHTFQFSKFFGSHEFFVSEKIPLRKLRAGHHYRAVFLACRT